MPGPPTGDKVRLRFAKTGRLRLLSHHDLLRAAERMLRRADLPFKSTGGFHPTPRLVFALSLPLGVAGLAEVVELELTRPLPAADVLAAFNRHAPDGLVFTGARVVPLKAAAVPRRAVYRLPLPPDRVPGAAAAAAELMAQDKVWADKLHPRPRRVNVRPYLRAVAAGPDGLHLDLWVTGQGTARAEELVARLGLADVPAAGAVLERAYLEIHDELTPEEATDSPPAGPPETAPLDPAAVGPAATRDDAAEPAWGPSPHGPVVE